MEAVHEKVRDLLSGLHAVSGDGARVYDKSRPGKRAKQVDAMVSVFREDYFTEYWSRKKPMLFFYKDVE